MIATQTHKDRLIAEGFAGQEPIGESRVFVRGQVRVSVTRLADRAHFHAGTVGQNRYTLTYEDLPADPEALRAYLDKLPNA